MEVFHDTATECLIAGRPLVPVVVGCVLWQQVQCTWTPSVKEQANYTGILPRQQLVLWSKGYSTICDQFICRIIGNCAVGF